MKPKLQSIFAFVLAVSLSFTWVWTSHANQVVSPATDAAPPLQPPGSNIKPGDDVVTQVAMMSERVELDVRATSPTATALVTATFNMRNLGVTEEQLQVRFPLEEPHGTGDGYNRFPEVQGLLAYADGGVLPTAVVTEPLKQDMSHPDKTSLRWASFQVSFPVKQDVVISVTYVISASQRDPDSSFYYVLETGEGWRGKIGRADFVVRLPYAVTPLNVYLTNAATTLGARPSVRGNMLTWRRTNLEPTRTDNVSLKMISPRLWLNMLSARTTANATPDDAEAVRGLARAYYALIDSRRFPDAPMDTFAERAEMAYRTAIDLQPAKISYRIEYAELLRDVYFFEFEYGQTALGIRKSNEALDQLEAVFAQEPQNALGIRILKDLEEGAQYAHKSSRTEEQKKSLLALLERLEVLKAKFGIATAAG